MSVKDRILIKRKELGLNQTELAKRAGLTPPSISQYESGARNPSYDAILKLANALGVKADYLISGVEAPNENFLDPMSELLVKIVQNLTPSKKEEIIDYALLSTGQHKRIEVYTTDPKQYARYIYEQYFDKKLPVDILKLVEKMNIKIIRGELNEEADGLLLKRNNTIILDNKLQHEARIKFTLSTLIGHLIIPWHTDEIYYYRKPGKSTLLTNNPEEMEAQSFTTNLITPPEELERDLSIYKTEYASLKKLKKLADEKYKVSLTSLCHRLVELYSDRFATVNSKDNKITKVFSSNVPIKEKGCDLDENSKAFELLKSQSKAEVFVDGKRNASVWLDNVLDNEIIYESSVFNPKYNEVYTLITRLNK